jgi:membrane-associated protease RseP (regulator of RpoE activity)
MTEDAPLEPVAPEPATEPIGAAVTEPVPTATPPGPPPWGTPPAAGEGGSNRGSTVAVPKWLLLVVAAIVCAGLGFAVGYAVAPDGDSHEARGPRPDSGFVAPGPFDNNGGGGSSPTVPLPRQQGGAFLGVSTSRSTDPAGARVVQVVPGSPAADAGLQADDVITKVDGDTVANPNQLARRVQAHEDGDEVTVTYLRSGKTDTARVTLATRNVFRLPTPSTTAPRS